MVSSSLLLAIAIHAQGWKVELILRGIDVKAGGSLQAGLFNNPDTKWNPERSFRSVRIKVDKKTMKLTFENVPDGNYAAAVFPDMDNNGELKRNFFTLPKEPVRFSNGQRIKLGAPGFKKCSFQVSSAISKNVDLVSYLPSRACFGG